MVSNGFVRKLLPSRLMTKGSLDPMRRNIPFLRAAGTMQVGNLRPSEIAGAARSSIPVPSHASDRALLTVDRWRPNLEDSVDDMLLSALLAQDKELAKILQELDTISKSLDSKTLDTQTLSDTLRRTALCAIKRSLLESELRSLALTDDLTCLYNRRAFLGLAGQQLRVARRNAQGLLLFFADVDNLKEINDTHGHQEGDLALIRIADALEETFRNSDVIARLGGDEFAVMALEASCEDREIILRRLAKSLKRSNADESRYQLSLSIGMARFDPQHPVTLGKLIANADEAMYEDKKNRRPKSYVS
jgi:diguanylate cyclase (GGDEF)-like protein